MPSLPQSSREIWIVAAKRTPFGALSGALKDISAIDLAVHSTQAALEQARISPADVDQVFLGNVQQTSQDAIYGARHVGLKSGIPNDKPALTVNRLCGSGFQAVINAAEQILLGEARCVVAAGSENMSQAPHAMWGLRDGGAKFGKPPQVIDTLWSALTDSYCKLPMAMTAENLAGDYGISREESDAFALRSQRRWAAAQEQGAFADELAPITLEGRKGPTLIDRDEHPRPQTTIEALAKLPPVFKKDGVVTAGNASGISDGAATLIVVDAEWAKTKGIQPLARLVQWGVAGVDPTRMGIGPAPAIRTALSRAGLSLEQIDLFDVNEAFAPQFLAVPKTSAT
jgi:acetyl-CoA acyltransferase 2